MSIFNVPLNQVTRAELQSLLEEAESEPLLWEAKGTEIHKDAIRKAVCAFANGDERGYLVLGVKEAGGLWSLAGVEFDDDPVNWVSNVVRNGVSPQPRIDVRVLPGETDAARIAIVQVDPVSTPPCFSRGTLFERVPGSSVRVKDPLRLAELYRRGETARMEARTGADDLCDQLLNYDHGYDGYEDHHLSLAVAVSSTGKPGDISSELFSESFERSMTNSVRDHLLPSQPMPSPLMPVMQPRMTQSSMIVSAMDRSFMDYRKHWWVQARWDGAIGVHYWTEIEPIALQDLAAASLKEALFTATELLTRLGGSGETFVTIGVDGGEALKSAGGGHFSALARRGPFPAATVSDLLPAIERELARASGLNAYEAPGRSGIGDAGQTETSEMNHQEPDVAGGAESEETSE